ncbi:MAG TPA: LLM class flavin-dependent oxidoreductase [Candidatus Limnocylindrales bacterium]|nr:LLM class flavin-dependent oxidoreductase [Candidatus Limnocylindrales bacterium]
MRFGAAFWVQRTAWPALREAVLAAEHAGWDAVWIDDHLLSDEGDWRAPKLEGWATLAAIAAITTRVRLGHLVAANTFRNPGVTAKLATTINHVSGGRLTLGLGGGWFEREHEAFGLETWGSGFGERLDRLDEAVMLLRRLLDGATVTHDGRFYRFRDAVCEPRSVQPHLPILVGGSGPRKTLRTVARYADLWNGYGEPDRIAAVSDTLRERCAEAGRTFEAIERTVTMDVVVRDDASSAVDAFAEIEDRHGLRGRTTADGTERGLNAGGPPDAIAGYLRPFADLGIAEVMWIFRDPFDLETIRRLPEVRSELR